jgi:high-affinity K+ transport system ATPase subunit B
MANANERQKVKVTINAMNEQTQSVECDGFAGIAYTAEEKGFGTTSILVGALSVRDLIAIHEAVQDKLISLIESNVVEHTPNEVLLRALFGGK